MQQSDWLKIAHNVEKTFKQIWVNSLFLLFICQTSASLSVLLHRQKRMMGMTPNEAELIDVESHYPTDRIPMEMKEKSVAENLLDKMSETQ